MIINLFSIFDPATSLFSTAWLILLVLILIITNNIWNTVNPIDNVNNQILYLLNNEVNFTLGNNEMGTETIIITTFILIVIINVVALYPQTFSLTSHLTITLPMSLIFWISLVSFGWINNTSHMLSHLLPQGTPVVLIIFIVIIELTSNIIRPLTLCVRLTANLIAGHLLITLLGNFIINSHALLSTTIIFIPILLTILETAVACIQAYVFITLITLYVTETN